MSNSYKNKNGRTVAGTAAALHKIYTENGGWDEHHKRVIKEAVDELLPKLMSLQANEPIQKPKKAKTNTQLTLWQNTQVGE